MISIKSTLSKKDQQKVKSILAGLVDYYGDFYLTSNRIRLSIIENISVLFACLKKGDKILFDDEGVALVLGYSDQSPRKYVKILAQDETFADKLIKNLNWAIPDELFVKIKENNPLKKILLKNRFRYFGSRGKECLLKREAIELPKKLGEKLNDNCITN